MKQELKIRPFKKSDWTSVLKIYKEGIDTGIATFETKVPSFKKWDKKFINCCRLIAQKNDDIIGFAVLSVVSKRKVYKGVAEVTVYVDDACKRKGVGKILLNTLITKSEKEGFWTLQASIFSKNTSSIALHKSCDFRVVGIREKIGKRNGKWHDNYLLERRSKKII